MIFRTFKLFMTSGGTKTIYGCSYYDALIKENISALDVISWEDVTPWKDITE